MGLGILEPALPSPGHVPGSVTVLDDGKTRSAAEHAARAALKYDRSGKVLLVPQPSDDPNDPLNWPLWQRDLHLALLSLLALLAATLSPLLAANTVSLAIYFERSLTDMALLTGYHLLGVGLAGFVFVPSARVWGKRHLYVLGAVVVVGSCVWGGATGPRYASFLWARVAQGVGLAPFEALVNASVGDLYHVHERGLRMALSNLALFGGAFLTPVFVGLIADRMGYQWTFYFVAIFAAALLPLLVLFCPETAYRREARFDIDTMGNLIVAPALELKTAHRAESTSDDFERGAVDQAPLTQAAPSPVPAKVTFRQSLALFNGRKTDEHYLHLLLRPFPLFFHPGILWACLIQGVMIGFTVLIGVTLAAIFLGPPLWFGELETGYMYTGAFIGALLGFALCGLLGDWSAAALTRWNGGVYEPEFRMVLVIPQVVLGGAGLYGFGWTAHEPLKYGWFWPDFFFALVVMGMVCGAVASALYIVDAHRDMSVEGFTCLLVFKNLFSFGLTFKGFDWLVEADSTKSMFIALGSVQVGICALSIPLYILGKKNRSFFHRHNVFFKSTDAVADFILRIFGQGKGVRG
ncbi:MFS transporter-like protein [Boeremia exigua]|uniref:MFS transporter-like protein n=1 Tax=Boeremia exigua TaxID=749465 RepID=UPI001E8EA873|nr:MFS transporter-like protein [Boeremia exigua]KAH6612525.1 MFS transporter-like protein [Boeremia exigua]